MSTEQQLTAAIDAPLVADVGSAIALAIESADGRRYLYVAGHTAAWQRDAHGELVPSLGAPVTANTLFDLASLTKPMATSTLIAQELSDAASPWTLDTKIGALLPRVAGLPVADRTVASLISHASGLPAWRDFYAESVGEEDQREAIKAAVCASEPQRAAGQTAVYSDLGFLLLGWALEATTGQNQDTLFNDRVARPLGLSRTAYGPVAGSENGRSDVCATEIWPPRCASGAPLIGVVHDDNCAGLGGVAGHAGLFGTAGDVAIWARHWRGLVDGSIGPHEARELGVDADIAQTLVALRGAPDTTWRGAFDTPSPPPAISNAGSSSPAGTFGHLGFTGTSVWVAPSVGSVVLLTNRVHPSRDNSTGIRRLRPAVHDLAWRWLRRD